MKVLLIRQGLGSRVRLLLAVYLLSCVGTGLVYPFTALYLVQIRGLGGGSGAAFFAAIAIFSCGWTPVAGRLVDGWDAARVTMVGVCCQSAGYALLAVAGSLSTVLGCAVLIGLGDGTFYAGFTSVMAGVVPPEQRRRGFAARYLAMNLGLGLGAAFAGRLIAEVGHSAYVFAVLYLVDAAAFLPFAATLYLLKPIGQEDSAVDVARRPASGGYRSLARNRRLMLLLGIQAVIVLFGYSQIDSAFPLLLTEKLDVKASVVGLVIAVNTIAVGVFQLPLGRLLDRVNTGFVLALCPLIWAAAAFLGLAATWTPGGERTALLIGYALAFAVGETCYASSYQLLLIGVTPARLLGRASAGSALSWNAGAMAGPALGIALAGSAASPQVYWAVNGIALVGTTVLALWLNRGLSASESAVATAAAAASADQG